MADTRTVEMAGVTVVAPQPKPLEVAMVIVHKRRGVKAPRAGRDKRTRPGV